MIDLTNPIFTDENKAREYLERVRWPDGPYCPHCGETEEIREMKGKSHRPGLYSCRSCRKQFSVTVGTLFERSHIPLNKWVAASYLLCASKKGMSAYQLHRTLGVTYKTAWFMAHRIREAMREPTPGPLGGKGKTVEVDEVYIGGKRRYRHGNPNWHPKEKVITLVERGGHARSFHVETVSNKTVGRILRTQLDRASHLRTDEGLYYRAVGREYASHERVHHGIFEYVRGDAHTNTIENYFSILKRGITGVYQHCSAKHLKRYLGEFDYRYSTRTLEDTARAAKALRQIEGKRLTYRRTGIGAYI